MDATRILAKLGFEILSPGDQIGSAPSVEMQTHFQAPANWGKEIFNVGALDQHEQRALRLQNWTRETWLETRARNLFKAYLFATDIGKSVVEHEPQAGGAIPDFVLRSGNKRIAVEVKELAPVDFEPASDIELYDPCRPTRDRMVAAEKKLGGIDNAARCLVLYARCTPWPIFDWRLIVGAMRDSREAVHDTNPYTIEGAGKKSGPATLDAVIVLDQLKTGYLRFKRNIAAQELRTGRSLSDTEYMSELQRARGTERDIFLSRLRVIVHESPNAQNPLPKDIFRGPYDEWYGVKDDGRIGRMFVGEEIQSLKSESCGPSSS